LTNKLDNLSSDIIEYLEKNEPYMVRRFDIAKILWDSYKFNYKDEKSFGVVLTRKLNALLKEGLIKKEDVWYGTPNSKPPRQKGKTNVKTDFNPKVEAALMYFDWRAKQHGNRFYKHLVEYEKAENKR